ncbi:hypothetical protein [Thermoflexus sp.]|uniref:hypothetical protein n=1 Tax=Thermoflexus sp. TaxID=1969742 RepID=UPI00262DAFE6|nr:hypothetical protein [Thermoflexus sp.]MCX7690237.1 hypothetical protein [Thermoflexus sp.]
MASSIRTLPEAPWASGRVEASNLPIELHGVILARAIRLDHAEPVAEFGAMVEIRRLRLLLQKSNPAFMQPGRSPDDAL